MTDNNATDADNSARTRNSSPLRLNPRSVNYIEEQATRRILTNRRRRMLQELLTNVQDDADTTRRTARELIENKDLTPREQYDQLKQGRDYWERRKESYQGATDRSFEAMRDTIDDTNPSYFWEHDEYLHSTNVYSRAVMVASETYLYLAQLMRDNGLNRFAWERS